MGVGKVSSLVEVQQRACARYSGNRLFGTKRSGRYQWNTYREFGDLVDGLRGGLASLGVGAGDRVALIADNRVEWAVTAYATYGLAACVVPMYEKQAPSEWAYILRDAGVKVAVVATRTIADKVRGLQQEVPSLEVVVPMEGSVTEAGSFAHLVGVGKASPVAAVSPAPEVLAGFIYTSGTTGSPKGVLLTHGNLASNVNAMQEIFPMEEADSSLSFLPWAHSFGQTCELHCMIANGASVGFAESVATIMPNLLEVRPTLLFSVPRIFNKIYDGLSKRMAKLGGVKQGLFEAGLANARARRALAARGRSSWLLERKAAFFDKVVFSKVRESFGGRLKYAICGGAALSREVAEFIDDLNIQVYEGYGLSETSPICTANAPGRRRIGSAGRAIPGVQVTIEPVEEVQDAGVGEIVIHGPNVMQGYHGLPEETAKVLMADGGFRTGDLGRLDRDGYLWITGRVKEQYKLENGKYVVPSPLEELLKLSPFISQVLLYGANRPYNVALIVPDAEALGAWASSRQRPAELAKLVQDDAVRALFTEEIAQRSRDFKAYERPRRFDFVLEEFSTENGMLTPSMKVKRRVVIEAHRDKIEALFG